jgi:hypothetical protein
LKNILIASVFITLLTTGCGSTKRIDAAVSKTISNDYTVHTAIIDKIIRVQSNGFVDLSYQVMWNEQVIIINDTILETHLKVGDKLKFMASYHKLESHTGLKKLLSFSVL